MSWAAPAATRKQRLAIFRIAILKYSRITVIFFVNIYKNRIILANFVVIIQMNKLAISNEKNHVIVQALQVKTNTINEDENIKRF